MRAGSDASDPKSPFKLCDREKPVEPGFQYHGALDSSRESEYTDLREFIESLNYSVTRLAIDMRINSKDCHECWAGKTLTSRPY